MGAGQVGYTGALLGSPIASNLASSGQNLLNQTNPEQGAANTQATNLVDAINLNGLSPGEYNATERAVNQGNVATGNLGNPNAMTSLSNALDFGGAFNSKIPLLGSALGAATNVSGQQNTQFNPLTTATNTSNTLTNFGLGQFQPQQANSTLTSPLSLTSSLFQPLGYKRLCS